MNTVSAVRTIQLIVLTLALFFGEGCQNANPAPPGFPNHGFEQEVVVVATSYKGEEVLIPVKMNAKENFYHTGVTNLRSQNWEAAQEAFASAVGQNPKDHKVYFGLGVAYEMLGNYVEAEKNYRLAVSLHSSAPVVYSAALRRAQKKQEGAQ